MSKITVILFLISSSFATTIGNFAPLDIGLKWIYSFNSLGKYMGTFSESDSGIIEIETLSKKVNGIDTLVLLDIKETYRSIYNGVNGGKAYDTIICNSYIDTAIITGDSIRTAGWYHCRIFPFWPTHTIDSVDLETGLAGNDTLHYETIQTSSTQRIYLQNVGLYFSDFDWGSSIIWEHTIIQLKSFNGHQIALGAEQHHKPVKKNPFVKRKASLSLSHQIVRSSTYSLSGQRIVPGNRIPIGIVITKDLEAENKGK